MTTIINSVSSIFHKAEQAVENEINNLVGEAEDGIKSEAEHIETTVEADTSRIVHELHVTKLAVGKDITIKFDSVVGEVKRIVVNGETTVDGLIAQLRSLSV